VLLAGIGLFLFVHGCRDSAREIRHRCHLLGGGMVQLVVFRASSMGLGGGALFTTAFGHHR